MSKKIFIVYGHHNTKSCFNASIRDTFIEEAEKSIEDCIRQTLEKEGGAAGKDAIVDACKEAGYSEEECNDAMSKMSDVKQHEHGDYILEAKNCGCGQTPCKTYGKQDEGVEESSEDSGEGPISSMSDEELMDYVGQREEDIVDDIQQHIAPDFLHKENYEEMFEKYREEVLEPAAEEISQDKAMDQMPDEMEMDAEESIEDTSGKALEAAMSELKKLAGLNEEDKKEFDKSGCMAEMKKLYANHCTKESMYSKLNAEYNCNRKQFEELYASHCG